MNKAPVDTENATGGWQRVSRREVYRNPWICVQHDEVVTPGGEPGIYGVVEFANHAVAVLPIDAEGYTYLVRQYRYPMGCHTWEIPKGGCPAGESSDHCARRELEEETGLVGGQWSHLGALQLSNSITNERADLFLARGVEPRGLQQLEMSEADLIVHRLPIEDAVAWVLRGEITDAMSVAALLRWQLSTDTRSG